MARRTLLERLAGMINEFEDHYAEVGSFEGEDCSWIEIRPKKVDYNNPHHIVNVLTFNGRGEKLTEVEAYKNKHDIHVDSEKIV